MLGHDEKFRKLVDYLRQVPAIRSKDTPTSGIGSGSFADGGWWIKFDIDTDHRLAWATVQELGYVLNYLSIDERLPTVFKPVSPPPYLNGGPRDFLSWVIECSTDDMAPDAIFGWLESRLPKPVSDPSAWPSD
jgi:hypothetical protein